jgi:pyruvate ferredoxin oxidoreductase gamma subunit
MFQVRIHGRGGQGVVTAAEMLSVAAFLSGREAQAFPSFGAERMGAPVVAFCRIDDRPIRLREPVAAPDAIIIQDATLLHGGVDLFGGLVADGYVLVNTEISEDRLSLPASASALPGGHVRTVDASQIARRHIGRPLSNAALLGGFVAVTAAVPIDALLVAIRQKFPGRTGELNAAAADEAFHELTRIAAIVPADSH